MVFQVISGILTYLVLLIFIPVAIYLSKINKEYLIKYVFIISYLCTSFPVDIVSYYGNGESYTSGNIVEVFLILSLPLFLNTSFFWLVSIGVTAKIHPNWNYIKC